MKLGRFIKKVGVGIQKLFRKRKKGGGKGAGKQKKLPGRKRRSVAELPEVLPPDGALALIPEAPEAPKSPPFYEVLREFSGVQLSANTQRAYQKDLNDFFAYLNVQGQLKTWVVSVGPLQIADYREHLVNVRKLSKSTVTRKLAVLKSFYRWTVARGLMPNNPAELVKSFPQTQDSKTGFLGDDEIDQLLESLPETSDRLFHQLSKVTVESLLMLGLRRSEASSMRVGDLEYLDGQWLIRIHGKGDRERRLPLPPRLAETWSLWLQRICPEAPGGSLLEESPGLWVDFCRRHAEQPILISSRARTMDVPLSGSEIARIVRKMGRKAGILNRLHPHMLRATAITHALDQGASHRGVQQMAGWTSPLMITRYDKRRRDPKFSAVHHLRYGKKKEEPVALPEHGPEKEA